MDNWNIFSNLMILKHKLYQLIIKSDFKFWIELEPKPLDPTLLKPVVWIRV